jgi:squalene-associated FAD-dependent desaturase
MSMTAGTGHVHVIGAGLAGLSAAVRLVAAGRPVTVHEGAGQAGGRCRSFHDARLDCLIDNGNHLLMSGNHAARAYMELIGAGDAMIVPESAVYPFVDLASGARWALRPGAGPVPWWIFAPQRRVPDTSVSDYLPALRFAFAGAGTSVGDIVRPGGALYERFWEPLIVAALNTAVERASARLVWAVLSETFLKGEAACRPMIAREGLGPALVAPALDHLARNGAPVRFNRLLRGITITDGRVGSLDFGDETITLSADDHVILAVPPARARMILPDIETPDDGEAIVNAHFRLDHPVTPPVGDAPLIGLVNATAHWIFIRENIVSLTISAADAQADQSAEDLLPLLWRETAAALGLPAEPTPPGRLIKEKRATFDQHPASVARRPGAETALGNLFLAGDWTDTGLPATIEGAIRSGEKAARLALRGKSSA